MERQFRMFLLPLVALLTGFPAGESSRTTLPAAMRQSLSRLSVPSASNWRLHAWRHCDGTPIASTAKHSIKNIAGLTLRTQRERTNFNFAPKGLWRRHMSRPCQKSVVVSEKSHINFGLSRFILWGRGVLVCLEGSLPRPHPKGIRWPWAPVIVFHPLFFPDTAGE